MISDPYLAKGNYDRIMFALITAVDEKAGKVSIQFCDHFGFRDGVPMPVVAMSRDAWIRFIPQVNDVVLVGIRPDDSAAILGWHPWAYSARTEGFEKNEKNRAGGDGPEMGQALRPGEIDIRSSGGGYLRFNNMGDVLLMGLSGRIHIFGIESLIEHSQTAFKVTDGQSWLRFGHAYRLFPGVSARELPTAGSGQPNNGPTPIREFDVRLFDEQGNLLVQESLGEVVNTNGVVELSGTSGNGTTTQLQLPNVGDVATSFFKGDIGALKDQFVQSLGQIADQVVSFVNSQIDAISTAINTVINGIGGSLDDIISTASDLAGIITGIGPIGGDGGKLSGIGPVGKSLRHRLLINKDGKQVYAHDIDEEGGVTISSESEDGGRLNANGGGWTIYAKKAIQVLGKGVSMVADNITQTAKKDIKHVAGGKIRRIAGTDVKDNGLNITRTAETMIRDRAGVSITQQSDGTITIQAATSLSENATTISVSASGNVTISGGGAVTITGGGVVTIVGTQVLIN
jgi:hypothetical protein